MLRMPSSLKTKILMVSTAILMGSVVASSAVNYLVVESSNEEAIISRTDSDLRLYGNSIESWMKTNFKLVEAAANQIKGGNQNTTDLLVQLDQSGGFLSAYFGSASGGWSASNGWVPDSSYDPRARPWYKAAIAKGETTITEPYVDAQSGQLVVTIVTPVKKDGQVLGVVGGDVTIDSIVNTVKSIKTTPSSYAFLSVDGKIIAHPDSKNALKPTTEISKKLTSSFLSSKAAEGSWLREEIDGQDVRVKSRSVQGSDWKLSIALDESELTAALRKIVGYSIGIIVVISSLATLFLLNWLNKSFAGLLRIRDAMEDISTGSGDLTKRLTHVGSDEVAAIAQSFNKFIDTIEDVLILIKQTSQSVGNDAVDISSRSQELSARTESTAASLQQASASLEELTSTVTHTAESSREANKLSVESARMASQGGVVVDNLVATMDDIADSALKINEIINLVNGVAFQTNILALNASVEAARAGESGRGFAVVAQEVRNLAERSADAAKQIKELVDASTLKTQTGSAMAKTAGASMKEIVASVERVVEVLSEINAATNEQSQGISQINIAVAELDHMTQKNSSESNENRDVAISMNHQVNSLNEAVSQFTLSEHKVRG
nr:methyl-accepting chemotaxis protein [Pseudomonas putida]